MLRFLSPWWTALTKSRTIKTKRRSRPLTLEWLERRALPTVSTTVAAPVDSGDNLIYVDSVDGFPQNPGFTIGVGDPANAGNPALYEHMIVTEYNFANFFPGLVVIRGADGTHDVSHNVGDEVDLLPHSPETLLWTGLGSNANWSNPSNWHVQGTTQTGIPISVAPQNGDSLIFGDTTVKATANDLSGLSLNSITFQSPGYTLSGNAITLSGNISDSASASATVNDVIALSGVGLSGASKLLVSGNIPLEIDAPLSGTGSLAVGDATDKGTVILGEASSYSGGTSLTAGTLQIDDAAALGTGALQMVSGTLTSTVAQQLALDNPVQLNGSANLTLDFAKGVTFADGVTLQSASAVTLVSGALEVDYKLGGSGALTVAVAPKTVAGKAAPSSVTLFAATSVSTTLTTPTFGAGVAAVKVPLALEGTFAAGTLLTVQPGYQVLLGHTASDAAGKGNGIGGQGGITLSKDDVSTGPSLGGYSGALTLTNCNVTIAGSQAVGTPLGTGALTIDGGSLTVSTGALLPNAVTLKGTAFTLTFAKSTDLELTGAVNVTAASVWTVSAAAGNPPFLQFKGNLHGAQVTLAQKSGKYVVNLQGTLGLHLVEKAYYLNLAGALTGALDVMADTDAIIGDKDYGKTTLTGAGAIKVLGTLTCPVTLPKYTGAITVDDDGEVFVGHGIAKPLGTGKLMLAGGNLTCDTDAPNAVTLANPVTLEGAVGFNNFSTLKLTGAVSVLKGNSLFVDDGTIEFDGKLSGSGTFMLDEDPESSGTTVTILLKGDDAVSVDAATSQPRADTRGPRTAKGKTILTLDCPIEKGRTFSGADYFQINLDKALSGKGSLTFDNCTVSTPGTLPSFDGAISFKDGFTNLATTATTGAIRNPLGTGVLTIDGGVYTFGGGAMLLPNLVHLMGENQRFSLGSENENLIFSNAVSVEKANLYLSKQGNAPAKLEFTGSLTGTSLTLDQYSGQPVYVNVQCKYSDVHLIDKATFLNLGNVYTGELDVEAGMRAALDADSFNKVNFESSTLGGANHLEATINVMGILDSQSTEPDLAATIKLVKGGQILVGSSPKRDYLGHGPLTLDGGSISANILRANAVTLPNAVTLGGNVAINRFFDLIFSEEVTLTGKSTLTLANGTETVTFTTQFAGSGKLHFANSGKGTATVLLKGVKGKLPAQVSADDDVTLKLL